MEQLEADLTDGMTDGSLRRAHPAETARAVFTAATRFHHPGLARGWTEPGIDHELDVVCTLLLDGLRPARPTA
ncbi:hypothetical protein COUCH_36600 [Couchioplanes caeruleus]|uniref:hypothetical protein n=1 Tax=Couchioplanes caeruleus TaxID=56438 RepID=UPI0020BD8C3E|nr:hypothetical protein [Couchioplanes caeruleus]UQU64417.1 hypothetical protein COUCH_36600 [Couchioplanes caeruleus]